MITRNALNVLIALVVATVLTACGAGGGGLPTATGASIPTNDSPPTSSTPPPDQTPPPSTPKLSFVRFNGNANGTWVLDANNEPCRFRADNFLLYVGTTTYGNVRLASSGGAIIMNGALLGYVRRVGSATGGAIAALVDADGYLLDLVGPTNQVTIKHTKKKAPAVNRKPDGASKTEQAVDLDLPFALEDAPADLEDADLYAADRARHVEIVEMAAGTDLDGGMMFPAEADEDMPAHAEQG